MNFLQALFSDPIHERAKQAAQQEPEWICWEYAAEEWQQFDHSEWRRVKQRGLGVLMIMGVIIPLGYSSEKAATGGLPAPTSVLDTPEARILIPIIAVLIYSVAIYLKNRKLHIARQHGPREIRIGPRAVTQPGGRLPLMDLNAHWALLGPNAFSPPMHTLREVRWDPDDPQMLRFGGSGWRNWPTTVRVPIPLGHEAEARQLVARFRQEILLENPVWDDDPPIEQPVEINAGAPTQRLPRPWYGGTREAQRYGPSAHQLQAPETPAPASEHHTQQLTPPDSK